MAQVKKTTQRKATAMTKAKKKTPVKQVKSKVGYGNPPVSKETQFKPGQSGNPAGPPKRRTQLWVYFCKYMAMTDVQLKRLVKNKLTQAQKSALVMEKKTAAGDYSPSERLARHVFNREEGKPTEYLVVGGNDNAMTDEECDEIRELLKKSHADK